MRRLSLLLICCAAASLVAAPAPLPRRGRETGPWVAGWDRPIDPQGGCRFVRAGGRLTVTVPGPGLRFRLEEDGPKAPRLTRDVEGDFVLTVRVSGELVPAGQGRRTAGLFLRSGECGALIRLLGRRQGQATSLDWRAQSWSPRQRTGFLDDEPLSGPQWLRLSRKGPTLRLWHSDDGERWTPDDLPTDQLGLARRVKVGVFVHAEAEGAFGVTFDRLEFTQDR
jgi:hypothetical protein